jgi:hypothetical protein
MWWKKKKASAKAEHSNESRGYDVHIVLIGEYDACCVVAVYEDRHAARYAAGEYNADYGVPGDVTRWARTEEISFYPAEVLVGGEAA